MISLSPVELHPPESRRRQGAGVTVVALLASLVACATPHLESSAPQRVLQGLAVTSAGPQALVVSTVADAPELADEPVPPMPTHPLDGKRLHVAVVDPAGVEHLEAQGFDIGEMVTGRSGSIVTELTEDPAFASIINTLHADIRQVARANKGSRVSSSGGWRLFDRRWLRSSEMSFQLTGVFNRIDRRAFDPETCGETRFLYRLAYETEQAGETMRGRLPMAINVVYSVSRDGDADCQELARSWHAPQALEGPSLVDWMLERGALSAAQQARWSLKSVETNTQAMRTVSGVRQSMAGNSDYVLRVFVPTDETRSAFEAGPMENTPDVGRLTRSRALRNELAAFLSTPEALAATDRGTLQLPERFLARRTTAVAPRGLTRLGNRPFSQVLDADHFGSVDFTRYATFSSPTSLLRRLDAASCAGCHQSRAISGFHHVGAERTPTFGALYTGISPHLTGDLKRREAYVAAIAVGDTPDEMRPLPETQGTGRGFGAPCGTGERAYEALTCEPGLTCMQLEDEEMGTCIEEHALGAPCHYGKVRTRKNSRRDWVSGLQKPGCDNGLLCYENRSGFPQGMCFNHCEDGDADSVCTQSLDLDYFQACLRHGKTEAACLAKYLYPMGQRRCDADTACRQDYVCVLSDDGKTGGCEAPYFVYQLRIDGYPHGR